MSTERNSRKIRQGVVVSTARRQDLRGQGRGPQAAPAVRQDDHPQRRSSTRTTRRTTAAWATASSSWRPGRCRKLKRWRLVEIVEKAK